MVGLAPLPRADSCAKNGKIWLSLKVKPADHSVALKQVDLHLIYLGRGNFIKLQERKIPLQVPDTPNSANVMTVVVGTMLPLSAEENKILNEKQCQQRTSTEMGHVRSRLINCEENYFPRSNHSIHD